MLLAFSCAAAFSVADATHCSRCCDEYEYYGVTRSPTAAPTLPTSSPTVPHHRPTKAPITLPPVDKLGCRHECNKRHVFLPVSVRRKPLKTCGGATIYWNCSCSASTRRSKKTKLYHCIATWYDPSIPPDPADPDGRRRRRAAAIERRRAAAIKRRAAARFPNTVKTKVGRPKVKG